MKDSTQDLVSAIALASTLIPAFIASSIIALLFGYTNAFELFGALNNGALSQWLLLPVTLLCGLTFWPIAWLWFRLLRLLKVEV